MLAGHDLFPCTAGVPCFFLMARMGYDIRITMKKTKTASQQTFLQDAAAHWPLARGAALIERYRQERAQGRKGRP